MRTIPVDSTDAREQLELEEAQAQEREAEDRRHAAACHDGWLGEDRDGHPVPCSRCRPHLALTATCATCGIGTRACRRRRDTGRPPCCDRCSHHRASQ